LATLITLTPNYLPFVSLGVAAPPMGSDGRFIVRGGLRAYPPR
jgi:hypothetical protein